MALEWYWDKPCGWAIVEAPGGSVDKLTLYKGNAFLIFMAECGDEYSLAAFWLSKDHAKNCLGLTSKYNKWSMIIREITLFPTECDWLTICKLLVKAYPEIRINIIPTPKGGDFTEQRT